MEWVLAYVIIGMAFLALVALQVSAEKVADREEGFERSWDFWWIYFPVACAITVIIWPYELIHGLLVVWRKSHKSKS
jgi:hypothetical protein